MSDSMSHHEELPNFFVPGLAQQLHSKFLTIMAWEEETSIQEKFYRITFEDQDQRFFLAQVGMFHPYFPNDRNDQVRFILRKGDIYKVFVCTPRHFEVNVRDILSAVQFPE